jgi:hypothetical protein
MSEDKTREEGFAIFKNGSVRRLSPTHYVVKPASANAWQLVELKNGNWTCDCGAINPSCVHLYAAQLHRSSSKTSAEDLDESRLRCRYCGSPDIARCGFRYNARGIARRYRCNDCQRKFSIPHIQSGPDSKPDEIVWLLNEVGMLISKLTELLSELNAKLDLAEELKVFNSGDVETTNSLVGLKDR